MEAEKIKVSDMTTCKEVEALGKRVAALEKRAQCLNISVNISGSANDGKHITEVVSRELQTAVQRKR